MYVRNKNGCVGLNVYTYVLLQYLLLFRGNKGLYNAPKCDIYTYIVRPVKYL